MKIKIAKDFLVVFICAGLSLTPLIWFIGRSWQLIDGVDTNFPLNPTVWFIRRFFVWNSVTNAGVDFSSSIAGIFFHLIQVIPHIMGFGLQQVQIISFLFWFSLIVSSSFFLAKLLFPKKVTPQLLFIVFYSFNPYLFNTWENVKVANLSLVAGIPLAISLLILIWRGTISLRSGILGSLIIGIVVSGSGINPSYFISFFLTIFIFFLGNLVADSRNRRTKVIGFVTVTIFILLVNSYWIFPTLNFISSNVPSSDSLGKIGFNNWVDSLSENTSIFNIMRLQGAWDWYPVSATGQPYYIPYATRYFYSLPFLIFSLIPASLVLVSLIFKGKGDRGLYLSFSTMFIVGVFLGIGTHLPTGAIFSFFLNHVPFFNLFRSPWYIFTPLVTLSCAGLIGLLFYNLSLKFSLNHRLVSLALPLFGLVLIVGNLLYNYPLITGKIFRPKSVDGFYINFPSYVFDAGKWLSGNKEGRVITYPDDEIEKFKWGYRGIESILGLLVDKDFLFSPLNATEAPVAVLVRQFYKNLKRGELASSLLVAAKLNVNMIFNKEDQESLSPKLPSGIESLRSNKFGQWSFYNLDQRSTLPRVYSSGSVLYASPYGDGAAIGAVDIKDDVVNPTDKVVNSINNVSHILGRVVVAKNLQLEDYSNFSKSDSKLSNRLGSRDFSSVTFEFSIPEDGPYTPELERYKLEDFGIDVNSQSLKVDVNGIPNTWSIDKVTDSYVIFKETQLLKGKYKVIIELDSKNLTIGGDFENGEMFLRGGYGQGVVNYEIREGETGRFLSLYNLGRAEQSADFLLSEFDEHSPYYVEIRYKQIYGNYGQIIAEQNTSTSLVKAQTEKLPNYPEWQTFSFYYQPVETKSQMKIFLVASYTKDPLGTKVFYDDLVVKKVFANNLVLIKRNQASLTTPKVSFNRVSPVSYEGTVGGANGQHIIVFSENYSPGWAISIADMQGKPINITEKHFSINLFANAWFVNSTPENYKFKIYYKPQRIFYIGVFVTVLSLIIPLALFLKKNK